MNNRRVAKPQRGVEVVFAIAIGVTFVGLGILAFTGTEEVTPKTFAVVILDLSASSNRDTLCNDLENILKAVSASEGEKEITILGTGDARSGFEPTRLGSLSFHSSVRLLEGKAEGDAEREKGIAGAKKMCSALPERDSSPLLAAVLACTKYFSDISCGQDGVRCEMWLRSDGIEGVDNILQKSIRRPVKRVPRLNNERIQMKICSLSERRGSFGMPSIAAVEAAWRPEFTAPDRVTFSAACGAFSSTEVSR